MFTDWNHTHGNSTQSQGDSCTLSQDYWLEEINQNMKKRGEYQQQSALPFILIIWAYVFIPWGDGSQKMNSECPCESEQITEREG